MPGTFQTSGSLGRSHQETAPGRERDAALPDMQQPVHTQVKFNTASAQKSQKKNALKISTEVQRKYREEKQPTDSAGPPKPLKRLSANVKKAGPPKVDRVKISLPTIFLDRIVVPVVPVVPAMMEGIDQENNDDSVPLSVATVANEIVQEDEIRKLKNK